MYDMIIESLSATYMKILKGTTLNGNFTSISQ
ncbi:UNVERIFIED_ORG: hypothetical protein DFS12_107105 [Chitinophaga ginsengisegetis]|nr:hypothetical protein [Chitinophaga ginsengisegetis]MDR6649676.1 hypothetical protein [Chitinophaga ginsengisegetis]MDR6656121.1 hypothetical protein [Chitinophaga ginsengisegetis]